MWQVLQAAVGVAAGRLPVLQLQQWVVCLGHLCWRELAAVWGCWDMTLRLMLLQLLLHSQGRWPLGLLQLVQLSPLQLVVMAQQQL